MNIRELITSASGADDLKSSAEVARILRTTPATLCRWRKQGRGPTAVRVGGKIFYSKPALEAWIAAQATFGASVPAAA